MGVLEKYLAYAEEAREFASRSFREEDRQFWLKIERSWLSMTQPHEAPQTASIAASLRA